MANETTTQVVKESPEIEARKLGLMDTAAGMKMPNLPAYQVAGFSADQMAAMRAGKQGIGAYKPYLEQGTGMMGAAGTAAAEMGGYRGKMGTAADQIGQAGVNIGQTAGQMDKYMQANLGESQGLLRGSVGQANQAINQPGFATAEGTLGAGVGSAAGMGQYAGQMGNYLQADLGQAQRGLLGSAQANLGQAQGLMTGSVGRVQQAAQQPGFATAQGALTQGIGALGTAAQGYDPSRAQAFMNPYQQQVINEAMRQINRQGDITRTQLGARAAQSGAFGGGRQAVESAELERALAEQKNAAITGALSQGFQSSQAQAMQAFEQEKQRQLAQAQAYQGAAGVGGNLAGTQANIGMQAGQYAGQMGQALGAQELQQAQLGQSAYSTLGAQQMQQAQLGQAGTAQQANILNQQGQLYGNLGAQQGALAGQRAQLGLQAAQYAGSVGQQLGAQQLQQAQLGQAGTAQQANIYGQQAGVYGQQAGAYGQQGALAGQQAATQANIGQGIAGLGAQAQALGQNDVNFLYNIGAQQQGQTQREVEALRQTQYQTATQPYQHLGFVSDIYKGAPSSQMAVTQNQAPSPSMAQQIGGLATGAIATGKALGGI